MAQVTTLMDRTLNLRSGQLFTAVDDAANDSDKTLTVPAGQTWEIQCLHVTLATSADLGNRRLAVVISDGTNTVWTQPGYVDTGDATTWYWVFAPYVRWDSDAVSVSTVPMPVPLLHAGWTIRVYDAAVIAVAADDLTVVLTGIAY